MIILTNTGASSPLAEGLEMEEASKVKQPRRSSKRSTYSETTVLELHSEKESSGIGRGGQSSHSDDKTQDIDDKTNNVIDARCHSVKEINTDNEKALPTTEFTFAEPKAIISEKQSRGKSLSIFFFFFFFFFSNNFKFSTSYQ